MQTMTETLQKLIGKPLVESTDQEIYLALLDLVRSKSAAQVRPVNGRKLYYISAEFLIGKLLSNNLINLGLYDDVRDALAAAGKSLSDIEEVEPEPSLGNGGLGRFCSDTSAKRRKVHLCCALLQGRLPARRAVRRFFLP